MSVSITVALSDLMAERSGVRVEIKSQYFGAGRAGPFGPTPWIDHYAKVSFAGNPTEFLMIVLRPEANPYAVANARTDEGHQLMQELAERGIPFTVA